MTDSRHFRPLFDDDACDVDAQSFACARHEIAAAIAELRDVAALAIGTWLLSLWRRHR